MRYVVLPPDGPICAEYIRTAAGEKLQPCSGQGACYSAAPQVLKEDQKVVVTTVDADDNFVSPPQRLLSWDDWLGSVVGCSGQSHGSHIRRTSNRLRVRIAPSRVAGEVRKVPRMARTLRQAQERAFWSTISGSKSLS